MRALPAAAVAAAALASGAPAAAGTERLSLGPGGAQGNAASVNPSLSGDGRVATFASLASNLVSGDTNDLRDVFARDRLTRTAERVSVGPFGEQANGASFLPSVSPDGRFVAFESAATNLVSGDTNGVIDIFVRDRASGLTERVSMNALGRQANDRSSGAAVSAGGRFVAFASAANNLVQGDGNGVEDVFVRDRATGATERVGAGPLAAGSERAVVSISADGRFVAFASGSPVLVAGDTNGSRDVFVRDRSANVTRRVSLGRAGAQADAGSGEPAISADGRFVAFTSLASNLVEEDDNDQLDVFVHELSRARTQRASIGPGGAQADAPSFHPQISADGDVVAFDSSATNLVLSDTNDRIDVFVRDRGAATTERLSIGGTSTQANSRSSNAAVSGNGLLVAFDSSATNLVARDTAAVNDVFARDRPPPVVGKSMAIVPVSGKVFVSVPSPRSRAAASVPGLKGRKFVALKEVRSVPVGSLLDTRKGKVSLTSARDSRGATQSGTFSAGVFQVLQSRRRKARGLTDVRLKGGAFTRCAPVRGAASIARHRTIRRVRSNAKGRFRTRGRYSAATVRGTKWTTADRCDGTLVSVRRGRVVVRDFRRRRNVTVRAGKRYLARAAR